MNNANRAITSTAAARRDRDRDRARSLYNTALMAAEDWAREDQDGWEPIAFKIGLFSEIAAEETAAQPRTKLYRSGLSLAERAWKSNKHPQIAEAHSLIAIDAFQDPIVVIDEQAKRSNLSKSRAMLDEALRSSAEPKETAQLLTRKSAILRHQAQLELTRQLSKKRTDESVACASKASSLGQFPAAYLELGLAEWARARFEKSDVEHVALLRKSEGHLKKTAEHFDDNAHLALARFYRMNFRPMEACTAFPVELENIKNVRKVLREAYIYGEAATQLWYAGSPSEALNPILETARELLELSLAAGNRNARLIVNLGFVSAILDGPDAGSSALADLSDGAKSVSWVDTIRVVTAADSGNRSALGLAFGIGSSQIWSSLGTYALTFMQDSDLAETLYREAVRVNPRDSIALTNLARVLAQRGTHDDVAEAQRLIEKAQSFADRRFFWWREVRQLIQEKRPSPDERSADLSASTPTKTSSKKLRNLKELPKRFDVVSQLESSQQRGYQLEILFYEAASLELSVANAPYRVNPIESLIQQVDGYVEHGVNKYRIECKWESKPSDKNAIVLFCAKLDAAGVDGIFVSMAGFTESAKTQAKLLANQKAILLIDGNEIELIFRLALRMGDLLTLKRQHFDMRTDVYYKVRKTAQDLI